MSICWLAAWHFFDLSISGKLNSAQTDQFSVCDQGHYYINSLNSVTKIYEKSLRFPWEHKQLSPMQLQKAKVDVFLEIKAKYKDNLFMPHKGLEKSPFQWREWRPHFVSF